MTLESSSKSSGSIHVNPDSSESTIGINIKTLDSQTFSLRVNKNIPVPALKEMIVTTIGVPPEQQRLIYRGKVLKDEQLLSELHMEDGDTLHLVLRQPVQFNPTSSTATNDSDSGVQSNRTGQVAHSVLVGTINVADRNGEAMLADLGRNLETFLGSLGLATIEPTGGPSQAPSISALNQATSGAGVERSQNTSRTEPSNSAHEGVMLSNSGPQLGSAQFSQVPLIQTLNQPMVISDALTTLSEFIDRMEFMLQNRSSSSNNAEHQASSLDARGLPTPEFLCSIMERAQQLLRDNVASALLHVSTRLQREGSSSDPVLRGQIQTEAMQLGVTMQHLGAMLLELGRTIMTLRMGQSPAESSVNAGPAVFISPTGPNPIMVQPNTLFGASPFPLISGLSVGASPGNPLSNINIHLHSGSSISPGISSTVSMSSPAEAHGERLSTEQSNSGITGSSNDSSSTRGLPLRTVVSATSARTIPESTGPVFSVTYPVHIRTQHSIPITSQGAGSTPSGGGQSREQNFALPPSISVPAIVAQVTARIANALTGNAQVQSSSFSMQPISTQGSHSVVGSGTQSGLPVSALQPPQMNSSIMHSTAQSNIPRDSLCSDSQCQNSSFLPQTSQGSSSRQENVLGESLFSAHNSVNVGFTEHEMPSGSGDNCTSDLTGSGKEGQQIQSEGNHINSGGSSISVEKSSSPSSSNVLTDSQSNRLQSSSSDIESLKREPESDELQKLAPSNNLTETSMPTPLGLGFGGLQTKKRSKPVKPKGKDDGHSEASSSDQNHQNSIGRVHDLSSLPSQSSNVDGGNENGSSSQLSSLFSQFMGSMPSVEQGGDLQTDFTGMIANALQSPAFNNLLTGVASQSRVSTGALKSMLEQCVHNPAVQNTVNQLVQEVGQSQSDGNIQGTGINRLDFTGMLQQMLPVVSQAFGRASTPSASSQEMQSEHQPESIDVKICDIESLHDVNNQIDLSQVLENIEQHGDSRRIFGTLLEIAGQLYGEENTFQDIVELGNDEELSNEFMEMLKRAIKRRLKESKPEDKP